MDVPEDHALSTPFGSYTFWCLKPEVAQKQQTPGTVVLLNLLGAHQARASSSIVKRELKHCWAGHFEVQKKPPWSAMKTAMLGWMDKWSVESAE